MKYYTMQEAESRLVSFAMGGAVGVRADIVNAMQALADMGTWESLRQFVRFQTQPGGRFVLPPAFESVVRITLNGTPRPIRGMEFHFQYSGPGAPESIRKNERLMCDPVDAGLLSPVAGLRADSSLTGRLSLALRTTGTTAPTSPGILYMADGTTQEIDIVTTTPTVGDSVELASGVEASYITIPVSELAEGTMIEIWYCQMQDGEPFTKYITVNGNEFRPTLRHYFIPGVADTYSVDCMAEVRPIVDRVYASDDIIPFQTLLPIQYMMQAQRDFANGNAAAGEKYLQLAQGFMKARDDTNIKRQTIVTFNDASGALGWGSGDEAYGGL